MWSFRGGIVLALCLLISGCGFTPMYAGGSPAVGADIFIANIPDRDGQYLRNLLIDRLNPRGRPDAARYELKIEPLKITATDLGIQKDATVTRTEIEIEAHLVLAGKEKGEILLDRRVHAVGGYDVLDQQYSTLVTRQNVKEHILAELADDIVLSLNLRLREAAP
jgi:LPS-assembly lipoprotein